MVGGTNQFVLSSRHSRSMAYSGRSFLKAFLSRFISPIHFGLTITDLGSNADRYSSDKDRTLDSATYLKVTIICDFEIPRILLVLNSAI